MKENKPAKSNGKDVAQNGYEAELKDTDNKAVKTAADNVDPANLNDYGYTASGEPINSYNDNMLEADYVFDFDVPDTVEQTAVDTAYRENTEYEADSDYDDETAYDNDVAYAEVDVLSANYPLTDNYDESLLGAASVPEAGDAHSDDIHPDAMGLEGNDVQRADRWDPDITNDPAPGRAQHPLPDYAAGGTESADVPPGSEFARS